ncbi:hypothetical protein [Blastopirellula marina]|uniref:Uncharacterized protein n=1 Tax=Blastopirellula marina TaxID=124 RepID=A0A2S8GIF2_9BACT|nr:hypothetical protein [Blastopirellula marina]PQO44216.1 hypothetical protein C5Y93_19785 [Blastopirellula marina]
MSTATLTKRSAKLAKSEQPATITVEKLAERLNRAVAGRAYFIYRNASESLCGEIGVMEAPDGSATLEYADYGGTSIGAELYRKDGTLLLDSAIKEVAKWVNDLQVLLDALQSLDIECEAEDEPEAAGEDLDAPEFLGCVFLVIHAGECVYSTTEEDSAANFALGANTNDGYSATITVYDPRTQSSFEWPHNHTLSRSAKGGA